VNAIEALADEIDIQTGATVSRVLVKDGPVRLVLFALDVGEELTEHTASLPVVLQTVSGAITVSASGEDHGLIPGGWILLEANEPHTVVAEEPSKFLLTMVRAG
jgi:quercetin dioxygenase-like cupin family protein